VRPSLPASENLHMNRHLGPFLSTESVRSLVRISEMGNALVRWLSETTLGKYP
jgi:hypothetical protein